MRILITALALIVISSYGIKAKTSDEETRSLNSFDEIKVAEAIHATLIKGEKNEVTVSTSGIELEKILTEVESGMLHVHIERGNYESYTIDVVITYTEELSKIRVSSAASIESEDVVASKELFIKASSSGKLSLPVAVEKLKTDVSSSGKVMLNGTAKTIVAEASSSGTIKAYDLKCEGAKVDVSSSGMIQISVSKEVIGQASSSGSVTYLGNPEKVIVETSSSGSIKKR